jgi:hypothetical protein
MHLGVMESGIKTQATSLRASSLLKANAGLVTVVASRMIWGEMLALMEEDTATIHSEGPEDKLATVPLIFFIMAVLQSLLDL